MPPARTSRTLLLILGYVVGVLLLGALLAPPLFFAAKNVIQNSPQSALASLLEGKEFPGYFNRAVLFAAVLGLWPLLKALRMTWGEVAGTTSLSRGWRETTLGYFTALLFIAAMGYVCWWVEACRIHPTAKWDNIAKPLLSGFTVSIIEEFLFRGAVLGILCRSLGTRAGLWWTTGIFALVHFLKPPLDGAIPDDSVTWTSGFWVITQLFRGFGHWENFVSEFLLLAAVGWVLGRARLATGGLWLSIGLHAGWVSGMKYFGGVVFTSKALRDGDFTPWMTPNTCRAIVSPIVGIVPLVAVLLTGVVVLVIVAVVKKKPATP
ncbi:MAG TPA: CPBP family intramembrane glutamic endopeptidase [Candidatus Saccharimonadia bacterium]|nr:CPBP family intramembrane glutamic endopeptidase [Candidatus Saccharimonadia bacterium]